MKYKRKKVKKIMEQKAKASGVNEAEEKAEQPQDAQVSDTPTPEAPQAETAAQPAPEAEPQDENPSQEEWAAALKKTVEERDNYKDLYLRSQAEFQNFKRRNATARADGYEDGVRETIAACLATLDNLELAIRHAEEAGEQGAMVEGVKMTLKLMTESLGKMGLEEVPALGEVFDPEKHNAVMRAPGGEENVICEVFQKGYKVKDRMIRYAMVKVYSGQDA